MRRRYVDHLPRCHRVTCTHPGTFEVPFRDGASGHVCIYHLHADASDDWKLFGVHLVLNRITKRGVR